MANNTNAQNELISVPEIVPTWWYFNQSAIRCSHVIYHHVIRSEEYTFIICLCLIGLATILLDKRGSVTVTGWARLIRSHSSARFCFELSGNSN